MYDASSHPRSGRPPGELRPLNLALIDRTRRLALWLLIPAVVGGCVRFYQPMSGLHRPVVVDPRLPNFQDLRLTVRCVPEDLLNAQEANALCSRVEALFENQGAEVITTTSAHGAPDDELAAAPPTADAAEAPADGATGPVPARTELTLELRARRLHQSHHPVSWVACIASFTVLAGITEHTFAQDVVIRDATGFPLVTESLEGRIVEQFGLGPWAGNVLLDLVARDEADDLAGDAFDRVVSADVYRQLSQMMFNAKMQWEVLQQTSPMRTKEASP